MSDNEGPTMSEESVAETFSRHQHEYIFGNMKINFMAFVMVVIQTIWMKMMRTNIILEKSKFDP